MAQYARPSSDIAVGGWNDPTWSLIDEGVAFYDGVFSSSPNKADGTAQCNLNSITDPASSSGHIMRVRGYVFTSGVATINIHLYSGGVLIKTWTPPWTGTSASYEYTLSAAEADAISNYADLDVYLEFDYTSGAQGRAYIDSFELEVPSGAASYSESVDLGAGAGLGEGSTGGFLKSTELPATTAIAESAAWSGFGAAALTGQAAMALERGLSIADEITLPTAAAIAVAAELGIFKAVSFGSQAGLSLSTVLAAAAAVSLSSGAGIAEARVSGILGSTTLPGATAMVEQSILDALDSLGLSVAVGISETALKDIAKALSLPSAAAIEVLHSLLIQGVLTLSSAAGVAMVGEVEAGAGQYYENTNLPALAATVYAALLDGLEAIILTSMAATDGVASIAVLRELSLTCEANFGLSSVLAAVALTSLSGTPGLSMEGEIVSIPKSLTHILGYSRR